MWRWCLYLDFLKSKFSISCVMWTYKENKTALHSQAIARRCLLWKVINGSNMLAICSLMLGEQRRGLFSFFFLFRFPPFSSAWKAAEASRRIPHSSTSGRVIRRIKEQRFALGRSWDLNDAGRHGNDKRVSYKYVNVSPEQFRKLSIQSLEQRVKPARPSFSIISLSVFV